MTYKEAKKIQNAVFALDCIRAVSNYVCVTLEDPELDTDNNWVCHICSRVDISFANYHAFDLGRSIQAISCKFNGEISQCDIGTTYKNLVPSYKIW